MTKRRFLKSDRNVAIFLIAIVAILLLVWGGGQAYETITKGNKLPIIQCVSSPYGRSLQGIPELDIVEVNGKNVTIMYEVKHTSGCGYSTAIAYEKDRDVTLYIIKSSRQSPFGSMPCAAVIIYDCWETTATNLEKGDYTAKVIMDDELVSEESVIIQ